MEDVFCGEVVLDDLVLDDTHSCLFDSIDGKLDTCIVCCDCCRTENSIYLLLREIRIDELSTLGSLNHLLEFELARKEFIDFCHKLLLYYR